MNHRPIRLIQIDTLPGHRLDGSHDRFFLIEYRGRWALRSPGMRPLPFPSLDRLAFTLGGMVMWDHWTPAAQATLTALGVRGVC